MTFDQAMEILEGPPTGGAVAEAAGVTLSSISRARRPPGAAHHRSPPREWRKILRRLATERANALLALAAELADA